MQVKAQLRYLHMSPRKVRRVAKLVQGMSVAHAQAQLEIRAEKAAEPVRKLLASAVANARQLADVRPEELRITSFVVNPGPVMKRFRPRSRGMAHPYLRRMSHMSVILEVPHTAKSIERKVKPEAPTPVPLTPSPSASPEASEAHDKDAMREKPKRRGEGGRPSAKPKLPRIGSRFFQRKSV